MSKPFIYKNKRIIPLEYSELHTLIIEASDNKIGLTFNPVTPLKLIPTNSDPFKWVSSEITLALADEFTKWKLIKTIYTIWLRQNQI